MVKINLIQGDITEVAENFDAIVNAANETLLGGDGVDGCIHKAAGPELLEECKTLNGCATGMAKVTNAYNIPCKKIIHAVGPRYLEETMEADRVTLFATYLNCFEAAMKNKLYRVAFPSISTGIFHFPVEAAAEIAFSAVRVFQSFYGKKDFELTWVLFTKEDYDIYSKVLRKIIESENN